MIKWNKRRSQHQKLPLQQVKSWSLLKGFTWKRLSPFGKILFQSLKKSSIIGNHGLVAVAQGHDPLLDSEKQNLGSALNLDKWFDFHFVCVKHPL